MAVSWTWAAAREVRGPCGEGQGFVDGGGAGRGGDLAFLDLGVGDETCVR